MFINSWLIVGKLCKVWGTVSLQTTLYILECSSDKYWCVLVTYIVMCKYTAHHINQDGVQKTTPQVTLYKPHTGKESLRRRKPGQHSQVLPDHPVQSWELWHCHQRITHSMCGCPPRLAFLMQHATHNMRGWPPRLSFLIQHAGTLPMLFVLVVVLFFSIVTSIVVSWNTSSTHTEWLPMKTPITNCVAPGQIPL